MRFVLGLLLVSLTGSGCARPALAPQPYAPREVRELSALPPGYATGPALSASCHVASRGSFEDEALADVDCSTERLSRLLRARAGEQGARFIVGKRCKTRGAKRECSAGLAVPTESVPLSDPEWRVDAGPAPSAAEVQDLDEPRPQDAAHIRVSFRAASKAALPVLPTRAYDQVAETQVPSVGRRELGQVSARCEASCDGRALRHALRVTAGRIGAGEVTAVSCFQEADGSRCVATALVPWSS